MSCWANNYIGGKYTKQKDCVWWVRYIILCECGFKLPDVAGMLESRRAHTLLSVAKKRFVEVTDFQDFDIIIMRWVGGDDEIHLGIYCSADGGGVVHAVDKSGVIFRSMTDMQQNGWEIVRALRLGETD